MQGLFLLSPDVSNERKSSSDYGHCVWLNHSCTERKGGCASRGLISHMRSVCPGSNFFLKGGLELNCKDKRCLPLVCFLRRVSPSHHFECAGVLAFVSTWYFGQVKNRILGVISAMAGNGDCSHRRPNPWQKRGVGAQSEAFESNEGNGGKGSPCPPAKKIPSCKEKEAWELLQSRHDC